MSHSKMRIRPGISEIFFLVVRWFSIRQFCSLLFISFGWFVWYVKSHGWKQLKSTVANVGRAWFFLCPYFLTAGWFRRHRNCMPDLEQRKNEVWQSHAGTALRLLPTRWHVTCSLVTVASWAGSELWPCWTQTPNRKESRYISFKYKTTFWCPNIWHPLETNPPNLQRLLYVTKMLTHFSSFLALSILHLSVYHEETQDILTNWKKTSAEGRKMLIYLWRNNKQTHFLDIRRILNRKLFEMFLFFLGGNKENIKKKNKRTLKLMGVSAIQKMCCVFPPTHFC